MVERYNTLASSSEGLYKEKGSKFIGLAYPVRSEEEVKQTLDDVRKEYFDARHHCYAYVLGSQKDIFRANDDGEPNHSAGDPILGQINSKDLTDTLVIVVRYFGGTKLGVSGLINAYRTAADEALTANKTITIEIKETALLSYTYEDTNEVMRLVSDFKLDIKDQKFEMSCEMTVEVKINLKSQLIEKIQLLQDLGHAVTLKFIE